MHEIINKLGAFHDGTIVESKIDETTISFRVEIWYLREIFDDKGDSIWFHLFGCDKTEYQVYGADDFVSEPDEIAKMKPEILYVNQQADIVSIECAEGILRLRFKSIGITLDTGEDVSIEELRNANNTYWDRLK